MGRHQQAVEKTQVDFSNARSFEIFLKDLMEIEQRGRLENAALDVATGKVKLHSFFNDKGLERPVPFKREFYSWAQTDPLATIQFHYSEPRFPLLVLREEALHSETKRLRIEIGTGEGAARQSAHIDLVHVKAWSSQKLVIDNYFVGGGVNAVQPVVLENIVSWKLDGDFRRAGYLEPQYKESSSALPTVFHSVVKSDLITLVGHLFDALSAKHLGHVFSLHAKGRVEVPDETTLAKWLQRAKAGKRWEFEGRASESNLIYKPIMADSDLPTVAFSLRQSSTVQYVRTGTQVLGESGRHYQTIANYACFAAGFEVLRKRQEARERIAMAIHEREMRRIRVHPV